MRSRSYLLGCAIVAALGGLLFGFDTAVISGAEQVLEKLYQPAPELSDFWNSVWHGFLVASALIGTIVGAVAVGKPADIFGRRSVMFVLAVLYFVSALGSAMAWDWYSFVIFRFIGGLGVGGASVVAPMYIAEISPAKLRGRLVALAQFNIVLGILLAFLSNYVIGTLQLGEVEWRWMFGVEAVPAVVYFLLLMLTPCSPRWLLAKGREDEARTVLERVGTDLAGESVEAEIREIKDSLDISRHNLQEPFFRRKYLKPIMLAVAIAAFNQLSGINAILYYSKRIFESAGYGGEGSLLSAVVVGVVNLVFTMAALAVIDHFGRKKLMIVGSIGYILSLGAVAWAFYVYTGDFAASARAMASKKAETQAVELVKAMKADDPASLEAALLAAEKAAEAAKDVKAEPARDAVLATIKAVEESNAAAAGEAVDRVKAAAEEADASVERDRLAVGSKVVLLGILVFMASHAFGQGAVIWVFISEIFPNRVRARGQALGSFTHWVFAAGISQTFPFIAERSGGHIFAFYGAMMVLQLVWVLCIMPETKGVPLEEIQKKMGIE